MVVALVAKDLSTNKGFNQGSFFSIIVSRMNSRISLTQRATRTLSATSSTGPGTVPEQENTFLRTSTPNCVPSSTTLSLFWEQMDNSGCTIAGLIETTVSTNIIIIQYLRLLL